MEMETETPRRVIAIIGRPNVGKSSIFNRISGRTLSIVHRERGVTRDRLIRAVTWEGHQFELIDTGGLESPGQSLSEIAQGVEQQAEIAIRDAAAILFVTNAETGLLPQDEEVAALLRRHNRPVFVAINKADNASRDSVVDDFTRLGFPAFPISALHYRGFEPLMNAALAMLPLPVANPTIENPLRVTIVGRPNAGKSSLLNRLLKNERLIVSDIPGTTRDSIDIPFSIGSGPEARHYVLTDTAGFRHPPKDASKVDFLCVHRTEKSVSRSDVVVLLIDATLGPSAQDKRIASFILEHRKGCVLAVNKWDLMKDVTPIEYIEALRRSVAFLEPVPVVFLSAKTGHNINELIRTVDSVAAHVHARLSTGLLNRTLLEAFERTPPPRISGRRLKLFYSTQTGTQPITVTLFVNNPTKLVATYETFLIRSLRNVFELEGAPVLLKLRGCHSQKSDEKPASDANRPSRHEGHRKPDRPDRPEVRQKPDRPGRPEVASQQEKKYQRHERGSQKNRRTRSRRPR